MHHPITFYALLLGAGAWAAQAAAVNVATVVAPAYAVRPFTINLSTQAARMTSLVANSRLPAAPVFPGVGSNFGADLTKLTAFKNAWGNSKSFSWTATQAALNTYNHSKVTIEGLNIHFIQQKSGRSDAIPIILLHGWPASFLEFLPVITPLTQTGKSSKGKSVSFDVIVPSLPGFAFSSAQPANWTLHDTARIFDTLMNKVLGYKTYSVFGTDWGCAIGYSMYSNFPTRVRASSFSYIPFLAQMPDQLAAEGIVLNDFGKFSIQILVKTATTGTGYFVEQSTEPNTIGLALFDNPVGQLAWMGSKILLWSDPRAGTGPSLVNTDAILTSVSLYYLTDTFVSAAFMYAQNPTGFGTEYTKAPTDAPLLFSAFKYNNQYWPPELVAKVGNMVQYKEHDFGGHFPGVDNPPALISDIRDIADYWK